ncbi:MAG: lipoate--protein ligase family protein [Planctomycetota bacterium]|jgi:lipoate-protein ligase A
MGAWRLLRDGAGTPALNMAVDEALLRGADRRPVLRLYAWEPAALSLGWFQPMEAFTDAAASAGAVIVRRPTGGGAIHHDRELTFCLVATPGEDGYPAGVEEAYEFVHDALRDALATLGAELHPRGGDAPLSTRPRDATLCFDDHTALDLLDGQGRKVVGSAQRRSGGRVLHHGSIPLDVPSLTPEAGSLALAAGRAVSWDEAADALVAGFSSRLPGPLVADTLSPEEREEADRLARDDSDRDERSQSTSR